MVAAIRRLIVISAEAENLLGSARFRDLMIEIGVLGRAAAASPNDLVQRVQAELEPGHHPEVAALTLHSDAI